MARSTLPYDRRTNVFTGSTLLPVLVQSTWLAAGKTAASGRSGSHAFPGHFRPGGNVSFKVLQVCLLVRLRLMAMSSWKGNGPNRFFVPPGFALSRRPPTCICFVFVCSGHNRSRFKLSMLPGWPVQTQGYSAPRRSGGLGEKFPCFERYSIVFLRTFYLHPAVC